MHEVVVRDEIDVRPEVVWRTIRAGSGVDLWFPAVAVCEIKGDQRFCTLTGGGDLIETIRSVDDEARRFAYTVEEHPLPVGPVRAVMEVSERPGERCEVLWRAEFDGDANAAATVKAMLSELYTSGIRGLETFHSRSAE